MFYSWSDNNKITTTELQIQYTGAYSGMLYGVPCYEFHRLATKEYRYVGMTEAAAKACQEAKLAQYTRRFVQWYNERGGYSPVRLWQCVASVTMDSDEDGLWTVNISVSEDQLQYCPAVDVTAIPYNLFDLGLDYDESPATGGYLRISSLWIQYTRMYMNYEQNITGFDRASPSFHVENSTDGGQTWTALTPTSSSDGQMYFNQNTWSSGLVRLRWGDTIISNVEKTPTVEYDRTLQLYTPYYQVIGGTDGAWRVQFAEDFPDFNGNLMTFVTKTTTSGEWQDATATCEAVGDRITTPYTNHEDLFFLRATYDGVNSNTANNLFQFLPLQSLTANTELNQVTTCVLSFTNGLEGYDSSKVSVKYVDPAHSRTYSGQDVVTTEDAEHNCTATIDVGNQIIGNSMKVTCTLLYDGFPVSSLEQTVYKEG